ncbi:MAG TPA: ATP-binding protein [Burkholderiales bacterium]|nr:ATP-binding protein [Burkholderiales bacterium]
MRLWQAIRRSVRRKTMAVVLATTLVALLVNAAAMLVYEVGALREAQVADLLTQAEILGRASAPALAFKDNREAAQDLAMLRARADIEHAAFYAADGSLFAVYSAPGASGGPPERAQSAAIDVDADRITLFQPIIEDRETLGTVYLRARSGLRERVVGYLGILGAVMALALAVAWLLSLWLQRAVTRPIQAVAAAAREVFERRDFSVRAEKSTEDEIGVLAEALNRMLADLEREMGERREAEGALKAADRRKDEFLATLAHELRNPLAPIRNALYIMQTARDNPAAEAEARAIIERQLQQMVRLVDDLLDVSRITTGKLALRRERVDLRAVAASALEAIEPLARARGHRLSVELPPEGIIVNADPTRLSQVFLNLLNNAVKFTDPGGRIEFHVAAERGELVARVRDSGVGIPPGMSDEIFEMFAQADRSLERSTMGLGVGLSLARRLVELHGGTIEAKSAGAGRGSEFMVRIPIPGTQAQLPVREAAEPLVSPASAVAQGHRILLADDNQDFANSLAAVLRRMGNEVRVEHDGPAALSAAENFRPDVAFLDIGLPRMNGFDLARRLRALPVTAHSVLVAVTGWGQPADRQLAKEAGFDDYMVKPVEIARIQALLRAT